MRESRLSGSVEGVMSNHDPYSDFSEPVGWFLAHQLYSDLGADIVMESITLKFRVLSIRFTSARSDDEFIANYQAVAHVAVH